jgi:hypothetical protein
MASVSPVKQVDTAWALDRHLSSVEEVQTPSPRVEGFGCEKDSPVTGSMVSKQTASGEHVGAVNGIALAPRTNGSTASTGAATNPLNGAVTGTAWQTQKKKRKNKKATKSENDAQALNPLGGDSLPADESLRKGG